MDLKRSDELDAILRRAIRPNGPGLALAVIKDGEVAHLAGYGLGNLDTGVPVTPTTLFHMASCAKPITGLGIVMLKEAEAAATTTTSARTFRSWRCSRPAYDPPAAASSGRRLRVL